MKTIATITTMKMMKMVTMINDEDDQDDDDDEDDDASLPVAVAVPGKIQAFACPRISAECLLLMFAHLSPKIV